MQGRHHRNHHHCPGVVKHLLPHILRAVPHYLFSVRALDLVAATYNTRFIYTSLQGFSRFEVQTHLNHESCAFQTIPFFSFNFRSREWRFRLDNHYSLWTGEDSLAIPAIQVTGIPTANQGCFRGVTHIRRFSGGVDHNESLEISYRSDRGKDRIHR